jgi:hypothetical protein
MADEYNRLALFSAPLVEGQQLNALSPQLPAGHPSNMLRGLRDMIPQIQADDSSTMSGITSRLGRTATALPRGALETMANWLQGTHDPNAVRIGEDTIAPLGLFGMGTGLANALTRPPRGAVGHIPADASMHRAGDGGGVTRFSHVLEQPEYRLVRENDNAPGPHAVMADNAKSSVPGTVVNAMGEQPQTIRAYHGTDAKFDKFDPAHTDEVGFHFGTKSQANARMKEKNGSAPWPFGDWRRIPVDIEAKQIASIADDPGHFSGLPLAVQLNKDGIMPDDVLMQVRRIEDPDGATSFVRDWMTGQGYDAVRYPNRLEGSGDSYMTFGTGNVRNARTGEVMYSDAAASSPGLAASASQQPDSGVLDILSRYGLY